MIELQNVSLSYDGDAVLENVTLRIPDGARIAFMGPSGCGKTSLLRLAAGLQKPAGGAVKTGGRAAVVFQEPRLLPWLTAAENVNAVLSDKKAALPEARRWLALVGLSEAADKYPAELSGGMCRRVSLARALAYGGDVLILDEPFQGVDQARRRSLCDLISAHAAGKTLLLATHAPAEAKALCETVYVYKDKAFAPDM